MRRGAWFLATLLVLAGCTSGESGPPSGPQNGPQSGSQGGPAPALRLVAYQSCDDLLASVRAAAKRSVRPGGFDEFMRVDLAMPATGRMEAQGDTGAPPAYSGTNTHEAGVDEPDIVKTDGRRIVTVLGDTLRVIDVATRRATGSLLLGYGSHQLLLRGDRALVLTASIGMIAFDGLGPEARIPAGRAPTGTRLRLVDLSGPPKIVSSYEIGAALTDARQTGDTARIVVTSRPPIHFPWLDRATDAQRLAANRKIIDSAPLDRWLPAYTADGRAGRVDCGQVSRPDSFSGTSTVTVLSFDLTRPDLGDGLPVAVLADAHTVYGTGQSLYLAHDERWRGDRTTGRTDLFQFDVSGARPVFLASGSVPGWLLNQYSLSEHDGVLRAATTTGHPWSPQERSESSVYTLRRDGGLLRRLGQVGGLGKGEQIHAVRFLGPTGYVVTFRRTDPLYTVDLRDPAHPVVAGELKIPGYSSYLHPVGGDRLLGIGQDATDQGRVTGLQVSLFDIGADQPRRLDQHRIPGGYSEAEHDPHAFLYWPQTGLLVVPYAAYDGAQRAGALLFRVDGDRLSRIGEVSPGGFAHPRRSLVTGDTLWVVSDTVAVATTLDGARQVGLVNL